MKLLAENTIVIECPPDRVWRATIDIENWPKWAPTISSAYRLDDGLFGPGSAARLKQPMQPETVWRVTEFEDGSCFAWEAKAMGIRMRAGHLVRKVQQGCESVMSVHVTDLRRRLFGSLITLPVRKAIISENKGLKAWCESGAM